MVDTVESELDCGLGWMTRDKYMITNQCMGSFVLITATLPAGPCLSARIQHERQGEQERQEKGGLSNREVHGSCVRM